MLWLGWLIDSFNLCWNKEMQETKSKHTTTPPITLNGTTKLGTMRPAFITSYYNDLFFVRDLNIPYRMDQGKKLKPKTNALLFIRWLVILSKKDHQVIQGFFEDERLKAGSWDLKELWIGPNQLELLLFFVVTCLKSTNKEDYKLTQINLNNCKKEILPIFKSLASFIK